MKPVLKLVRSQSFGAKFSKLPGFGQRIQAPLSNFDFEKSIEYGTKLFEENKKMIGEIAALQRAKMKMKKKSEKRSVKMESLKLKNENLESENNDLRRWSSEKKLESASLITENEKLVRELQFVKSSFKRVMENNKMLGKKNRISEQNEEIVTRKFSNDYEFCDDNYKFYQGGNSSQTLSKSHSVAIMTPSSPSSIDLNLFSRSNSCRNFEKTTNCEDPMIKKKSRSHQRQKKLIRSQKRRIRGSIGGIREGLDKLRFTVHQTNLYFSQLKFEVCRKVFDLS